MKLILLLAAAVTVHGFPSNAMNELRQASLHSTRSTSLLGDLIGRSPETLSRSGTAISRILTGRDDSGDDSGDDPDDDSDDDDSDDSSYTPPGTLGSPECSADTCCPWSYIAADMATSFTSSTGCTALARGAIRLAFHDSATWNTSLGLVGAHGSNVLNSDEASRRENNGLQPIIAQMKTWFGQYSNITMADLIQVAAATALVSCPGGPRVKTFVGRTDSTALPPQGLIPSPFAGAQANIALFAAKTFSASDLVALLGAHTVSTQTTVDASKAGDGQDSTPGTWDNTYYSETASAQTPPGVFKFPSDVSLSNNTQTSGTWQSFANSLEEWNAAFEPAFFRLSVLGVNNLNDMTDCTDVLPGASE